jgi:hypothetical protein
MMSFCILSLPSLHAMCGATGAVIALCVVLQALSLHCAWYCRCSCHTMHSATGAVVALRVVPQVLLSCCAWYHRRCCRAVHGVAGVVVMLHMVSRVVLSDCGCMVMVAMLCAVSWSLLLWCVMLSLWS